MISFADLPPALTDPIQLARPILERIEAQGGTALIVGGFVRDLLLQTVPGDLDIATDLEPDLLAELFQLHDVSKNKGFDVKVTNLGGRNFEITRFRGTPSNSAKDGMQTSGAGRVITFAEDAARRDFTINAMGLDIHGHLHDPFGGQEDIHHRLLRCVGNPDERMREDPMRALRAVRFAARFGFSIEEGTSEAIRRIGPLCARVPVERLANELMKMAACTGPVFAKAVRSMAELDLLRHVLPEIEALRGLEHHAAHHPEGGVFDHVLKALETDPTTCATAHLAILFHDLGKAVTLGWKDGRPTYFGHDRAGRQLVTEVTTRLRLGRELTDALSFVAEYHMQVHVLAQMRPSKVIRLVRHPHWALLKQVARCDTAAKGDAAADATLERTLVEVERFVAARPPEPVISGRRVMELTGLQSGPEIGRLIREVTAWAMDNNITGNDRIEQEVASRERKLVIRSNDTE